MKQIISLLLCAAMALSLCACGHGNGEDAAAENALNQSEYVLTAADVETPVDGGGAAIAVAVGPAGVEDGGYNAAVWNGVRKFCQNFNYMAQSFAAVDTSEQAMEDAVRQAAESGATLVVCAGKEMETAVYAVQDNYPTVSYLLLDGEPHNIDSSNYKTAPSTHCVLFREEQAGYLAGYAAVREGYTDIGFLGGETMPATVRYGSGFLQGAQDAAEEKGLQVSVRYWFSGIYDSNDIITAKVSGWYAEGTQVVFVAGGTLARSCTAAAAETGGLVIAAEYDQSDLGNMVISSAVKCLSRVSQQQLYNFFAAGGNWGANGGSTETVGAMADAVALGGPQWSFHTFTLQQYEEVYARIKEGTTKVERYSDTTSMPQTPNLTLITE